MRQKKWIIFSVLVIGIQLILFPECSYGGPPKKNGPAKVEPMGNGLSKITLTPKAAERLDIQMEKVLEDKGRGNNQAGVTKVVPYSTILYDPQGNAWVYISPESLVYLREPIEIAYIEGDKAYLTEGPAIGTNVVTIGVIELYGAETGIGK